MLMYFNIAYFKSMSSPQVIIRRGRCSDEKDERFKRVLGCPDYVLEDAVTNEPVARCFVKEIKGQFVITHIEVREDMRRKEYGRKFIQELEKIAAQKNYREIYAEDIGPDSKDFWYKVGFQFSHYCQNDIEIWKKSI